MGKTHVDSLVRFKLFKVTTWGDVQVGDAINLEIDTLARYVARLADYQG
jgi:riboflavin synthase alpha subunit